MSPRTRPLSSSFVDSKMWHTRENAAMVGIHHAGKDLVTTFSFGVGVGAGDSSGMHRYFLHTYARRVAADNSIGISHNIGSIYSHTHNTRSNGPC